MTAGIDDLGQLLDRIEAEGANAMREIGFGDRRRGLHRMHEAQHRLGQEAAHQPHLRDGGDVVMGDARIPQHADQLRRGVGLDGIEHLARELLDEETGGAPRGVRAIEDDGFVRTKVADYSQCVGIDVQLKGPPKRFC